VGSFPDVPAGERSFVGIGAIAEELPAPPVEVVADEAAVVAVLEVVEEAGELLQAASPMADAQSATSDQMRIRHMELDPFECEARPHAEVMGRTDGSRAAGRP
jgi:hypothetical protein